MKLLLKCPPKCSTSSDAKTLAILSVFYAINFGSTTQDCSTYMVPYVPHVLHVAQGSVLTFYPSVVNAEVSPGRIEMVRSSLR